jgi:hypothetical protein
VIAAVLVLATQRPQPAEDRRGERLALEGAPA